MEEALERIAIEKEAKTGELYLGNCGLRELPKELSELIWLKELNLWNNQISDISVLKDLQQLQSLDLSYNQISDISVLKDLQQLQTLDLSDNQISDISVLKDLQQLQTLDLSDNQISDISVLKNLQQLQSLSLYNNQISNISVLKDLQQLQTLYLNSNRISDISVLKDLPQLRNLELYNNQISDISVLKHLQQLQTLNLRNNQISHISVLKNLKQLQTLDLSDNQISDISVLKDLQQLQSLSLSDNQISDISALLPLIRLNKMQLSLEQYDDDGKINLYGNPITNPPIEIIEQGNQAVIDYFDSLENLSAAEKKPLKEIKILLVGEGEAGKTSLLKQFKGLDFNLKESQTHGINIEKLALDKLPIFKENQLLKGVTGRFWDFGGQEIMHASHQFFLTNRSIYILVVDSRNDTKHEYWLQHIEKYGGDNSNVFVVINKMVDNSNFGLRESHLNKKYPFIKNNFYKVSCKHGKGIQTLVSDISETIPKTTMLTTPISIYWHQVKEALEAATTKSHYISEADFIEICNNNGVKKVSERKTLLGLLNALGIVLHFENLSLKSFFVLDPHWVTIGVYKIINSTKVENGILNCNDLSFILNKEVINTEEYDPYRKKEFQYKSQEELYLINIMEEFELAYALKKGKRYLVPNLLPVEPLEKPTIDKDDEAPIHFILEYDFLPNAIMSRFIFRMKDDIHNYKQLWRTGLVLENKPFEATALVEADEEEKRIYIYVSGNSTQKRAYFSVIYHTLWGINNSFKGLKPKQLMTVPNHRHIEVDYDDLLRRESNGRDEYYISELNKDLSISKDFLDKISTKAERMQKENKKGDFHQTNNFYAPVQGVGQNENLTQNNNPTQKPEVVERKIVVEKPKKKSSAFWIVAILIGLVMTGYSYWIFDNLKIAIGIGIATALVAFRFNPKSRYIVVASTAIGLLLPLNFGFKLYFNSTGKEHDVNTLLDFQEPHYSISLGLVILAIVALWLDYKSRK